MTPQHIKSDSHGSSDANSARPRNPQSRSKALPKSSSTGKCEASPIEISDSDDEPCISVYPPRTSIREQVAAPRPDLRHAKSSSGLVSTSVTPAKRERQSTTSTPIHKRQKIFTSDNETPCPSPHGSGRVRTQNGSYSSPYNSISVLSPQPEIKYSNDDEILHLKKSLSQGLQRNATLISELAATKKALQEKNDKLADADRLVKELKQNLATTKAFHDTEQSMFRKTREENTKFQEELKDMVCQREKARTLKADLEEAKGLVIAKEKQIEEFETAQSADRVKFDDLGRKLLESLDLAKKHENHNRELETQLDHAKDARESLRVEKSGLQQEVEQLKSRVSQLEADNAAMMPVPDGGILEELRSELARIDRQEQQQLKAIQETQSRELKLIQERQQMMMVMGPPRIQG
ncbi:uncharacterized protein JN550_005768 [Neoarthrinium moseri]|uniref:uncharacterized protein n=1 Tax=Neoarthrinium moseri TaxID=1658444 RepID=UPI001FDD1E41|nr:uncharacterized protein JN550_005768 [Neoarthrinium moseri]KAI1869787.1 hypothetical protein JN550_005768 [Neoarthrinium moseri]